jgi:iron complex outermembrane receptor protein
MVMQKLLLFCLSTLITYTVSAQKISGTVKDDNGKASNGATVSLLRAKDSVAVKFSVTKEGNFQFSNMPAGDYLLSVSHVGYQNRYSAPFNFSGADMNVPGINMQKLSASLQGVTVSAKKPMIEVKADKTILNVEGTINAVGNDALELLRKAPGVMVDKDDNITLAGKNGVQVFIDGKPSPLAGADLANYLKSTQSAQIESIEIITNPSAKYEAAGNAGIINIRLKKNKSFGTNGSVNAGYVQGFYPKFNGGINLNNRNKKVNVFGSYNYNNGKYRTIMNLRKEQLDTLFLQNNKMIFENNSHNFKGGIDYFINAKNTLGVVVNGNIANNSFNTSGPMYFTYIPTGELNRILRASNTNDMDRTNLNYNINYRYAVPSGKELNLDADYGMFKIRSNQFQPNYYYQADGVTEINRAVYNMIAPTDIDLLSFKADYEQNFKGGKLGFGTKISFVQTDNDFQRYNVYTAYKMMDTLKSNRFEYEENINALYVNYNKQYKKFMFQAGLRAENTHSTGTSTGFTKPGASYLAYDSTFKKDYTDFFPSASITFNKNPLNQWTITYSRRIDRPVYQDLNPFEFKLNEYTFMKGNTLLRPQYTNSFGLTNIYKYKLTTTLNYSHVNDIFAQIPDTIDKTKGFLSKQNLANQDVVAISISYPYNYKWYSFFATTNANYSHYEADLGKGEASRKVDQKVFSLTYYMQNSFKLGKGWTGELIGLFISPSVWQGLIRSKAMGSVDVGFQKTVIQNKGTVRLTFPDVFQTMKWGGTTKFAGVNSSFAGHSEMPQMKLNFSFRFGNSQVKAARQRKSAIEEENKRTQQSSGGGPGGN